MFVCLDSLQWGWRMCPSVFRSRGPVRSCYYGIGEKVGWICVTATQLGKYRLEGLPVDGIKSLRQVYEHFVKVHMLVDALLLDWSYSEHQSRVLWPSHVLVDPLLGTLHCHGSLSDNLLELLHFSSGFLGPLRPNLSFRQVWPILAVSIYQANF